MAIDPKDVKKYLKEAKSLLKKEDGQGALKIARAVLRLDDKNYTALISEGYALQLLKKPGNSLDSYKKAAKVDPHSQVAWRGIIDHYEKNGFTFATKDDVLEAYKKITISLEKDADATQYIDQTLKFVGVLQSQGDFKESIKVLGRLIKNRGNNPQISRVAVGVFGQMKTMENFEEDLYLACLAILHGANNASDDHLKKYFTLLYQYKQYEVLKTVCFSLSTRFNAFYQPMEYLCRLYLENRYDGKHPDMNIVLIVEKLFKLYPSSQMGYFAQGKIFFDEGKYSDAIGWFKEGIESKFNEFAVELLIISQLRVWDFLGAEEYCLMTLKNKVSPELKTRVKLFQCQALLGLEKFTEVEKALEGSSFRDTDRNSMRAEMLAVQAKWVELQEFLKSVNKDSWDWKLSAFKNWNNPEELYTLCETMETNFELVLMCAVRFFVLEDFMKCILTLNFCLNLSSTHPIVQFYISKLHKLEGNTAAAKSYAMNAYKSLPTPDVGSFLSDLYFETQDHEANRLLLLEATKKGKKAATKWAWLRLGIVNLALGEANDAVVALHSALMTDHLDCTIWETLADAYFSRGSYETSLRAYTKCLELGAHPTYPKFRIGVVHQHLGEEEMAVTILSELGDYNPALVELSKAWLQIAKKKYMDGLDASVIQAIYESMKASGRALFLSKTTQLLLPLKIIAECALISAELNKSLIFKVPAYFVEENGNLDEVVSVNLEDMLFIGLRATASSISNATTKSLSSSLETDMARLYYQLHIKCTASHIKNAMHHARRAVLLDSTSCVNWNTLGVIAAVIGDGKLAQHCFIKSVNLNPTGNATAWCNLGYLYITNGDFFHAHKCFNQGQACEPTYAPSWIGQALSAEDLSPTEAMDLFRHACVLDDTHIIASLGYAEWVCKTLESERTQDYIYNIEYLEAVSTSLEKLWLYNVRAPTPSSINLQGILQSHENLFKSAEESFQKALTLTKDTALQEAIKLNLISVVLELKDYNRVLDIVGSIPKPVFRSTAAAAVALEKMGESAKAYEMYENLKKLTNNEVEMSGVMIAQGIVAFKTHGIEQAKTLLFRGCQSSDIPEGYFALCALSLMNNEQELTQAVISEVVKRCTRQKHLHDIAVMHSFYLVSQGLIMPALRSITTRIHSHPYNGKLRSVLSSHLINFQSEGGWARSSLLSASYLGERKDYPAIALTYLLEGDTHNAFKSARKAVKVDRQSGTSWVVLVSSMLAQFNITGAQGDLSLCLRYAKTALINIEWDETDPIQDWLQTFIKSLSQ